MTGLIIAVAIIGGLCAVACRLCYLVGILEGFRRASRITEAAWSERKGSA